MSYNTLVMDARYLDIPGVEYAKFEWQELAGTRTAYFVQSREGVLPKLLTDLAVWRKGAKEVMAAAEKDGNKALEAIMNGYVFLSAFNLGCQLLKAYKNVISTDSNP
jgi:DNA polymerase delta subunit 1